MSYRSDVTIACGKRAYNLFLAAIHKYKVKPQAVYKTDQNTYILQWEWWKWSNDSSGVAQIEKVMRFLDYHFANRAEYHYRFIRIGEDYADVEELYNGDYDDGGVEVVREVRFPNQETLEKILI